MINRESCPAFEMMDWEAEATRIALAFGIENKCQFISIPVDSTRRILRADSGDIVVGELKLFVMYMQTERLFLLQDNNSQFSGLMMDCQGAANRLEWKLNGIQYSTDLAKGLFHLGLLDAQAESALKVTIAAHQKIEWALEMGARNPQFQA